MNKETKVTVMLYMHSLGQQIKSLRDILKNTSQLKILTSKYEVNNFNLSLISFNKEIEELVLGICKIANVSTSITNMVVSNCEIEFFQTNEIEVQERISRLNSLERMTNKFLDSINF